MEAVTMSALLTDVGTFFTQAITWFGDIIEMVVSTPLLVLMVVAIPICGYVISKIRSLMSI